MNGQTKLTRLGNVERLALALALLAGLFLASALWLPAPAPVHALEAPRPAALPAAAAMPAAVGPGVKGTIAAIGALAPQTSSVFLPVLSR